MAAAPFPARRRRALQAAAELLDELEIDQEHPIDVFGAIAELGLWLVFENLHGLLGALLPTGPGGVMITTEREPPIQRYTAAHEIGHLTLDHEPAFDTEDDVLQPDADERERLAQTFASYFLMPPPLVHAVADRHGVTAGGEVSPGQAYLVARDMQVSYEAAIRQLQSLQLIDRRRQDQLIAVPRLRAKRDLAHGHRPIDGYADIWPVDERSLQHHIDLRVHDEIIISLPENTTTGYRWLSSPALTHRAERQPHAAPAPFAQPPATDTHTTPDASPPRQPAHRSAADVAADLTLLPAAPSAHDRGEGRPADSADDPLVIVSDRYQAGWADLNTTTATRVRRRIAGATTPDAAASPERGTHNQPIAVPPGVGAAGRRWLALQARTEGHWTYVLHYTAQHDPHAPTEATFTINAEVGPAPRDEQRRLMLDIDIDDPDTDDPDTGDGFRPPDQPA